MMRMLPRYLLRSDRLPSVPASVRLAGAAFLWTAMFLAPVQAGVVTDKAEGFVRTEAARATAMLGDRSIAPDQRARKFQTLIVDGFDITGISRYVCGQAWDVASDSQKRRFLDVFGSALARIYADRLRDYSGESVEVTDATPNEGGVVVTTAVVGGSSRDTRSLDWNVVGVGKGLKLFDVVIDGVSTVAMTRDDYASVLDESGGDLDALTARLSAPR